MTHEDENRTHFDVAARDWDADPQRVHMGQKVARAMSQALAPTGSERALEFGAGTGLGTMILAPKLAHVTTLDQSEGMLEVLREKCTRRGILDKVTILRGSVPDDLPAGPWDLVYSAMTLHHVADVPALFRALAARLVPGGRIALADLDAEDGSFHGAQHGVAHHGFTREAVGTWLREAGFADIAFSTAYTVHREAEDGTTRGYPIFLVIARRSAN